MEPQLDWASACDAANSNTSTENAITEAAVRDIDVRHMEQDPSR